MIKASKDPRKRGRYGNAKTGKFFMSHPEKFCGAQAPEYKSELELLFMKYADSSPAVLSWGYETSVIRYLDESQYPAKVRRYFIDFVCKVKAADGGVKTVWVEIKPEKEASRPSRKCCKETMLTWVRNQCKWKAARQLAAAKGYEFKVLTERQLK